jgi:hypothetical protein
MFEAMRRSSRHSLVECLDSTAGKASLSAVGSGEPPAREAAIFTGPIYPRIIRPACF